MPQRPPQQGLLRLPHVGHPSTLETFIPVWGSGREAVADFQDGDYLGAAGNAALAASDLMLAGGAVKGAYKVYKHADKMADAARQASYKWDATRKRMLNNNYVKPNEPGHHAIIPQGGWGKDLGGLVKNPKVGDFIRNQEYNITPLTNAQHKKVHKKWAKGGYDPLTKTFIGSPPWARGAMAGAAGDAAAVLKARQDKRKKR